MPAAATDQNPSTRLLIGLFRLSPAARKTLSVGAVLSLLVAASLLCLLLFGGPPGETTWDALVTVTGGLMMVTTPLVLFFMILAALLERRAPPRAVLWGALAVFAGLAGAFFAWLAVVDMRDAVPGLVFFLVFIGPIFLLLSLPAVYYLAKTIPEVRAVMNNSRDERVLGLIEAHGKISTAELVADAGLAPGDVDGIIDDLLATGRLKGQVNQRHHLVFTSACLDAQQRLMLDLVRSGGRLHLDQLAAALSVPGDVLNDWIYQVVQRGQFSGYINWKERRIYSVSAGQIGGNSQCPNCGGQLAPGGGEMIRCIHCGSEVIYDTHD